MAATTAWTTVRVFISSTFRDMHAERDHLVRFVFPRLRERLLARRVHLIEVDLRWGVTAEQNAMSVCRTVIDECHPRFICILGGRYGWTPAGHDRSITADEVYYGVLDRPANGRGNCFFYFRHPSATAAMIETHPGEYREPPGSSGAARLENLKSAVTAAGLRPFVYPARWDNSAARLTDLKTFGQKVYDDLLSSLESEIGAAASSAGQDAFADESAAMDAMIEEQTTRFVLGSRRGIRDALMRHAGSSTGDGLLCVTGAPGSGKSALMAHFVRQYPRQPRELLLVHFAGASGVSGDVAGMLRRFCHELFQGARLGQHCSERVRAAKESLRDLHRDVPKEPGPERREALKEIEDQEKATIQAIEAEYAPTSEPAALRQQFELFLQLAAGNNTRVVVVVDAINQLDNAGAITRVSWLPQVLPAGARVVVTTLPGPTLDDLRARHSVSTVVTLASLTPADADAIIGQFLERYHKSFTSEQRSALLTKPDAGIPLYLLAVLEELRTLGTYDQITERIRSLPGRTTELFAWILRRLEADPGFRDATGRSFGTQLVARLAGSLAASRNGLSQRELVTLLDPGDSRGNVAALLHLLRPYLMRRGPLLDFYHGQCRAAAEQTYLDSAGTKAAHHDALAAFFRRSADPLANGTWSGSDEDEDITRPFREFPFHLRNGSGGVEALAALLLDFNWLKACADRTLILPTLDEFDVAHRLLPREHDLFGPLSFVEGALRLGAHAIEADPGELPAQLLGRLGNSSDKEVVRLLRSAAACRAGEWLMPLRPTLQSPGGSLLGLVSGHAGDVTAMSLSTDQQFVITAGADRKIQVWEVETGVPVRTFQGMPSNVNWMRCTPADEHLVIGSADGAVQVCDFSTGKLVRSLAAGTRRFAASMPGHTVTLVSTGPGVWAIATSSTDGGVRLWDISGERQLRLLVEPRAGVVEEPRAERRPLRKSKAAEKMPQVEEVSEWRQSGPQPLEDSRDSVTLGLGDSDFELNLDAGDSGLDLNVNRNGSLDDSCLLGLGLPGSDIDSITDKSVPLEDYDFPLPPMPESDFDLRIDNEGRSLDEVELRQPDQEDDENKEDYDSRGQLKPRPTAPLLLPSRSGRFLVVDLGGRSDMLIWDLHSPTGAMRRVGDRLGRPMLITDDGRFLVQRSADEPVVYDLAHGTQKRMERVYGPVSLLGLAGDSVIVAIAVGQGAHVFLRNLASGEASTKLPGRAEPDTLATANGGAMVVAANESGVIAWDLDNPSEPRQYKGLVDTPRLLTVSSDGRIVVTAARDGTLAWWDLSPEASRASSESMISAVEGGIVALACAKRSPLDLVVVTGSNEGAIDLHHPFSSTATPVRLGTRQSPVCVAMRADGQVAISGSRVHSDEDSSVLVLDDKELADRNSEHREVVTSWDATSGDWLRGWTNPNDSDDHNSYAEDGVAVCLSQDGRRIVSCGYLRLHVRDARSEPIEFSLGPTSIAYEDSRTSADSSMKAGHANARFISLACSADGTLAASVMDDGTIRIWDLEQRREVQRLKAGRYAFRAVALTPDGTLAVSVGPGWVIVWDVATGAALHSRTDRTSFSRYSAVAISQDGKRVAYSDGRALLLWTPASGAAPIRFTGDCAITSCAFVPDGNALIAGDQAGRLHLLRYIHGKTPADVGPLFARQ